LKDPPSKLISPNLLNINELHAFCKPLTEEFQSNHGTIGCAKEKTPFILFTQLPNRSKHKKLSFRSQDCDSALLYGFCRRPTVDEPPETSYLPLEKEFSKETITGHSKILSLATDFKELECPQKMPAPSQKFVIVHMQKISKIYLAIQSTHPFQSVSI
jgi:hypothetical protein